MGKSIPICNALKVKSSKYAWAKDAYDQSNVDRKNMAETLFDKLCEFDNDNYYLGLYNKHTEDQLSTLMSHL